MKLLLPVGAQLRRRRAWNFDPSYASPLVNMYGCTPCPRCREPYRCSFVRDPQRVYCDDCGYRERVRAKTAENP
jgi:hypothetical protein